MTSTRTTKSTHTSAMLSASRMQMWEEHGQLSLMVGFQAISTHEILIDKLLSLNPSIPMPISSLILPVDLTTKGKVCLPFWNESALVMSQLLWLPTKTDSPALDSTLSDGGVNKTIAKSWFSTRMDFPQNEKWWKTFLQLSTYLAADSTDSENTNQPSEKTKKYKLNSRHKNKSDKPKPNYSQKIRLYPDEPTKLLWGSWIAAARFVYNRAIAELKDKGSKHFSMLAKAYREQSGKSPTNSMYFRTAIVGGQELPDWVKEAPRNIKDNAVEDAWDAYHRAIADGGSPKFRSCKSPSQTIKFNPDNYKDGVWYSSLFKRTGGKFTSTEPLPDECTYSTQLVKQRERWYAIIPKVVKNSTPSLHGIIALDPGVRAFLTGFDGEKVVSIGDGDIGRITRLCMHLDNLISRAELEPIKKRRRCMRKAANRIRAKIQDLIKEVHCKSAAYLTDNYKVILLPTFETSQMIKRGKRKIGKKSVRSMLTWSHYKFKQHLKQLALRKGVTVIDVDEAYTSKTCTACGHIHTKLGGAKVFNCPNCGHSISRDANGARNILLRALRDTSKTVNDDCLAIAYFPFINVCKT